MKHKKGFTLIELLIVIVVIGILSAMMMLSSTEAVSSAKAARIVNNLRNWRTAALSWYIDNYDRVNDKGQILNIEGQYKGQYRNFAESVPTIEIAKYLNGEFSVANANYSYAAHPVKDGTGLIYFADHLYVEGTNNKYKWLIGCNFGNDEKVKAKLEARASTANLIQKLTQPNGTIPYKVKSAQNGTSNNLVFIEIMDFSK